MLFSKLIWIKFLFDLQICNILENVSLWSVHLWVFEFCQKSPPSTYKTCSSLQITWYSKWSGLGWEFEIPSISKINLLMLNPFEKLTNEGGTVTDNIPLGAMRVCAKPPFRDSYIGMLKLCYSVDRTDPDKKNYHGFCRGWNRSICNMLRDIFEKWLKFTVSKWFITF